MTQQELALARNADLRASLSAIQRAALQARRIAIQTNTAIVVMRDGALTRVEAEELRKELARENGK
jgi:hypothetical protein